MAICKNFRPTVLSGDTSQLVHLASYVENAGLQDSLQIKKILYTSEPITRLQRSYLESVFGDNESGLQISSALASAEMGIWAVSNFAITGPQHEDSADFIFDSRHMIVEVLPLDVNLNQGDRKYPCTLEFDKPGLLVVTSLQRLRNPLVRYLTGDIGSVHRLPSSAASKIKGGVEYLRVLRLQGRDIRSSFKWEGEYFEFSGLKKIMSNPVWGILRWQIILDTDALDPNSECLEVRMMRMKLDGGDRLISQEHLIAELKEYFYVHAMNESLFNVKQIVSSGLFIRSDSGNKVIMFVDRRKAK
jgi:phenylacetate-coenzyme A ligase PaaK-like adenylate-forming protein